MNSEWVSEWVSLKAFFGPRTAVHVVHIKRVIITYALFQWCLVLVLSVIACFYFFILNYTQAFHNKVVLVLQTRTSPDVSVPGIPFEYWIEHVTFELLNVMLRFSTRIFYRSVPGLWMSVLAMLGTLDKPLAYCMRVHFGSLVWNYSGFVSLT